MYNGFFDLVPGRVYFVPQGGRITNAVMLEADTKGTAAVALVCEVGVDTVNIWMGRSETYAER